MPILNLSHTGDPEVAGDGFEPTGTTSADHPEVDGSVVYDDVIQLSETFDSSDYAEVLSNDYGDLTVPLTLYGTLQRRVVKSTETGLHSFYYRVTSDANSTLTVFTVVVYPPMSTYVEVDYRLDGLGGEPPIYVDPGLPDEYFKFNGHNPEIDFQTNIVPGSSSKFFLVLPFAKKHPDGSTDFRNSGSWGFTRSGGHVALGITTSTFPIGFVYPAPTVLPAHYRPGGLPWRRPGRTR